MLGITANYFYESELRDLIKPVASGGYSPDSKAYLVPETSKDNLMKAIFQYCYDHEISIVDVPQFVYDLVRAPIPF